MADSVALIDRGRIVLSGPLDQIKQSHRSVSLRFDEPQTQPPALAGSVVSDGFGRDWTAVCPGPIEALAEQAAGLGGRIVEDRTPSLDEIFVARVGRRRHALVEP